MRDKRTYEIQVMDGFGYWMTIEIYNNREEAVKQKDMYQEDDKHNRYRVVVKEG